ncbi:MAG: GTPase Era [Coxiellaceae bacterium]|nr:GTPase Era [Coxiellaceae bacterium]
MSHEVERSGVVAIIGRPNVGKSTLQNRILGRKLSITSRKPQTTRQRIIGIKTEAGNQVVYVDTPGLHSGQKKALNRYMNRVARSTLQEVDLVVFMVQALQWTSQDRVILSYLEEVNIPVLLVVNKIDLVKNKMELLPFMEKVSDLYSFSQIIPLSAKQAMQTDVFEQAVLSQLSPGPLLYPAEQVTDRSDRFLITEFVREKLTRQLGEELPYSLAVTIDVMEEDDDILRIACVIWVEKSSQKMIVIGHKGERIKLVGMTAREDLERYFDKKVFLQLWVKIKSGWVDDAKSLTDFGYTD